MWFWLSIAGWMVLVGVFAATSAAPGRDRLLTYLLGIPAVSIAAVIGLNALQGPCPDDASDCDLWTLGATLAGAVLVITGFVVAFVVESVRALWPATDRYEQR